MHSDRVAYRVVQGRELLTAWRLLALEKYHSGSHSAGHDGAAYQLAAGWIRCAITRSSTVIRALIAFGNAHQKDMLEALHWAYDDSDPKELSLSAVYRVVFSHPLQTFRSPTATQPPMWGKAISRPTGLRESLEARTLLSGMHLYTPCMRGGGLLSYYSRVVSYIPLKPVFSVALFSRRSPLVGHWISVGVMNAYPGFCLRPLSGTNQGRYALSFMSVSFAHTGCSCYARQLSKAFALRVNYFMHICMGDHPVSHWVRNNTGLVISDLEGAEARLGKENSPSIFRPYCDNSLIRQGFYTLVVHLFMHICRFLFFFNHLQTIGLRVNHPKNALEGVQL